jgi:alanine racemase
MNVSRRAFLGSLASLPALASGSRALAAEEAPRAHSSFDPWVEVHAGHLRLNVEAVRARVGARPILAVVKNNGYGLGTANVGRVLDALDAVAGLAVVKLDEAVSLREAGIRKPVLLMGPFDQGDLVTALRHDLTPMVYTPIGPLLDALSSRLQRRVPVHVCVDTGIGRVGVPHHEAAGLIRDLASRPGVRIEGMMMTFTEDPAFDKEQLARFDALCAALAADGVVLGRRHAASSFGLFQHPEAFLDMVRPGMALYGIYPEESFRGGGVLSLRPAVALRARVAYVKQLRKGDSAGYERAYVAERDVWVATIPVGHADGLPRAAAKGARVRIGERLYPLVATVSASHSIAEIGPEPRVQIGDLATYFDWEDGSRPEDVAKACGGSVYDLTMHLNPLLPRRVLE